MPALPFSLSEKNLAIDMGTSFTMVYEQGRGIVTREPTVVAVDKYTGKISKYGEDARKLMGRTPAEMIAINPVSNGVISDYELAAMFLKEIISSISSMKFMKPCVLMTVPSSITGVEERAMIDAAVEAGARRVYLLEKAIATAVGAGVPTASPGGHMIIDIGGGTTEIAVVSAGGIVRCESLKFGGNAFDEAIVKYVRNRYKVMIGLGSAEEIKKSIGTLLERHDVDSYQITGRVISQQLDKAEGNAGVLTLTSSELIPCFAEPMNRIMESVRIVLETITPDLFKDVKQNGIIMSGGGSLLYGIDRMIERSTGIRTVVVDDAVSCAAYGAGKMLEHLDDMRDGMKNFYRRRQLRQELF